MKGYDINFIVKQQLLGLDMEDNYVDDYYFCATFSKKGKKKKLKKIFLSFFSFWITSISTKFCFKFITNKRFW